jgi:putative redox protein
MPTELSVRTVQQEGMHFVTDNGRFSVCTHYPRGEEEAVGLTPLEMLLGSLAACLGGSMVALLGRTQEPVDGVEVSAHGVRRDEHPTCFTSIELEVLVRGHGLDTGAVAHALELSEKAVCPVWAMLKDGTQITSSVTIVEATKAG